MRKEELILLTPTSLFDVFDRFKTQEDCLSYLEILRWHEARFCPHCGSLKRAINLTDKPFHYRCTEKLCGLPFTVLTETLLEKSKLPLRKWMAAFFLTCTRKNAINSIELSTELDLPQKTAWYLLYRIRECCIMDYPKLKGIIEADETYIGGKYRNKHLGHKAKNAQGRSLVEKACVFGMLERDEKNKKGEVIREGNLVVSLVEDASSDTLIKTLRKFVQTDSIVVTDEWKGYSRVYEDYLHIKVNHSRYEMEEAGFHTNQLEGAWGQLKQMMNSMRGIERKHLPRIIKQFEFMYNHRRLSPGERFQLLLTSSFQKKLASFTLARLKADKDIYLNAQSLFVRTLERAVREKQMLRIKYTDAHHVQTERVVEPIGLVFYRKRYHMIGWCHLRNDYRNFRVEGIEEILPVKEALNKRDLLLLKEYMRQFKPQERLRA
ncbi:MAG TPA: IS1595 family transposase [Sediminibacterium sp.]|nr:IS1595 family transposase [Sediminibacterium sp.]